MTGFGLFLINLVFASAVYAGPITDPYVKNLALVGVIHVEGARTKGQSVAVLREKSTGRTRILHRGDSILEADLEVREFGPQQITLGRGEQTFVLRVEYQSDSSAVMSNHVESTEAELTVEKSTSNVVEFPMAPESDPENQSKPAVQVEQRRLIPDPDPDPNADSDCEGEECAER